MSSKTGLDLTIGERLRVIRKKLKKSQKEMAKLIGISVPAWQGYELNKNTPGSGIIGDLIMLGFNANWILAGEGEMETKRISAHEGEPISFKFLDGSYIHNTIERNSFRICYDLAYNQYNEGTQEWECGPRERNASRKQGRLLYALLKILSEQSEEWQTEEKAQIIMEILLKISDDFEKLKNLNMGRESIHALISFLFDPCPLESENDENKITRSRQRKRI